VGKTTLKELLHNAAINHDDESTLEIIERFMPIIEKNARILRYDGAESDLIIHLIEVIFSMKPEKIDKLLEGQAVNYIVKTIKNKRIDIARKKIKACDEIHLFESGDYLIEHIDKQEVDGLLEVLSERQKNVIVLKYFYGYSDVEIAKHFGISRQAVNKIHRVAIGKMKAENS